MRPSLESVLNYPDAISQVQATRNGVLWLATIAAEDGRVTVRQRSHDGEVTDLTPEANVRSRTMEYGGGAYAANREQLAYCDDRTRQVWLLDADGTRRPLTKPDSPYVYGGLHLSVANGFLLAVREDHSAEPEPRTEIVSLPLDAEAPSDGRVIASGADFYAGPTVMGRFVAWYQWNHPDMSWDTAEVWKAPIGDYWDAYPAYAQEGVSALYPLGLRELQAWAFVTDESGYWNWRLESGEQWRVDHDCAGPTWVLNRAVAAAVGDRTLASVEYIDGKGVLALWNVETGEVTYPLPGTTDIESIAAYRDCLYVVAEWADRPATLLEVQRDGEFRILAGPTKAANTFAAAPVAVWADGTAGPVHSWLYLPEVANPPMIVLTHGGPTAMANASYNATTQFWASRGFAVLDVNYSGSTGFGREYRDRLRGTWGELDVDDVATAVREVTGQGLADAARVAITGGSAGGFTTLRSLTTTDVYAAGVSRYGIGYLPTLATDTHKAESRYLDGLISPWPDGRDVYEERSPINHLDRLSTPMLVLQGRDDKVVPPAQAEQLAEAVRAQRLPLALVMFDGEGHGFRGMAARRQALEAQVSFLEQVFGMEHSDDVPRLEIENLNVG
ncbi:alpha/beta hydrolase family protein [Tessaracoccus massiliensis]|uniref:alpha/beta hydrolase family protein n=1 Tax=Tessaracoccus massiliensis TaxID=1522311 RepID=UPI00058EC245|nr:prolyl oligopeptidase family serine peptidase [Tessaracoccus massiliensis]